ncbi:MAG: OmpA family protein [Bacteroidota bacterium]
MRQSALWGLAVLALCLSLLTSCNGGTADANERLRRMTDSVEIKDRTLDRYREYLEQIYYAQIQPSAQSGTPVPLPEDFFKYLERQENEVIQPSPQPQPQPSTATPEPTTETSSPAPATPDPGVINQLEIPSRGGEGAPRKSPNMHLRSRGQSTVMLFKQDQIFDPGSFVLNPRMIPTLDSLAVFLTGEENHMITVEGHADKGENFSLGQVQDAWSLSTLRATTIVNYLVARGVSPFFLMATGRGTFKPRVPAPQAANRRVEIILTPISPKANP